ncbi:uncharacterized protein C8Q71DRAFT_234182 [Rhodofomes roseus]|uniref:Uncharacterized protein n=1 Tax=Rhodofomes roseus TaxID=34475 RepID=A0ABQ8KW78_9APHY|nr:uncharacterized protein C8Q71DRAFT_234182 [Rhodofomes roseus]KAH9843076.1 hypothetical protein C8Q71DRAFT_234182 [Rhodofomes roseus]
MRYPALASAALLATTAGTTLALQVTSRSTQDALITERGYHDDLVSRDLEVRTLEARRRNKPPPPPPPPPPNTPTGTNGRRRGRRPRDYHEIVERGLDARGHPKRPPLRRPPPYTPRPRPFTPPPSPPPSPPMPHPPPPNIPGRHHRRRNDYEWVVRELDFDDGELLERSWEIDELD